VEVWAETWPALQVFMACGTQWSIGPAGLPVGLRYEVLPFLMKCHGVKKKDRADMLNDLKTCERTALDAWSRQRGQ